MKKLFCIICVFFISFSCLPLNVSAETKITEETAVIPRYTQRITKTATIDGTTWKLYFDIIADNNTGYLYSVSLYDVEKPARGSIISQEKISDYAIRVKVEIYTYGLWSMTTTVKYYDISSSGPRMI